MKLWDKGINGNSQIEEFTVGNDRELDQLLAKYDVLGSLAHSIMLESIGLLGKDDLKNIKKQLVQIYHEIEKTGTLIIDDGIEDIHSQIELLLTQKIGEAGKKIHTARSRNDQVLLDLRLFSRNKIIRVINSIQKLFNQLIEMSEQNKQYLLPGYTHLQIAMPSSFGLWFAAYAESLTDDLQFLNAAYKIVNQNPLGSAAGYGSSFPINRGMTTRLLGFDSMNVNVVYAQMGRGKTERIVTQALGSVAATLSKMSTDLCLFACQNFDFISLPEEFTTGSSIMPHKKNPDVFELIRAKCNKIQSSANEVGFITNNLPSGYFRDYQVIKESYLKSFDNLIDCIDIMVFTISKIQIKKDILNDTKYITLYSVEEINKEIQNGIPFRDAYKKVAERIRNKEYKPDTHLNHTHEGSIGNLCNEQIMNKFKTIYDQFDQKKIRKAEKDLLDE